MNKRTSWILAGLGCGLTLLLALGAGAALLWLTPLQLFGAQTTAAQPTWTPAPGALATQQAVSVVTPVVPSARPVQLGSLAPLYDELNPGVVSIQVFVERRGMTGQGAGSGFVLDLDGHIVTNDHVVAGANRVTVVFYDTTEADAEIVGGDPDSDLAVLRVSEMPDGVIALPLADSDDVHVGDWVVAIGNPFGLSNSMSLGIVSAVGRMIPALTEPFSIPQAIQTDAAVNPGNSGGPLLNLAGAVVGVNAQIASSGAQVNTGVGFAIPANIVRRVVPVLIETGGYQWPWLGVSGTSVGRILQQANDLPTQRGGYIHEVVSGAPADQAELQGTSSRAQIDGLEVPVGGDVVIAVDGESVLDWSDLLTRIALRSPGDQVELTVLREGEEITVTVELEARTTGD